MTYLKKNPLDYGNTLYFISQPYPMFTACILNLIVIEFKTHLTMATDIRIFYSPICFPPIISK